MEEQIEHDRRAIEMYKAKIVNQYLILNKSEIQNDNIESIQFVDELPINELKLICLSDIRFDHVPSKLTKLHFVSCVQANFTGLEQMRQLTFLRIYSNMPSLQHVNFLNTLVNLIKLDLSANKIKDLSSVKNLIELKEIDLSFNKIEDISPLRKLVKTEILNLQSNKIVDINPLKFLKELKELYLQKNLLFTVKPLQFLQKLTVCDVNQNMIQDLSIYNLYKQSINVIQFNLNYKDLLKEMYNQLKPTKQQQLFSLKIKIVNEQQEQKLTSKLYITQLLTQARQILDFSQQSHIHWTHNVISLVHTLFQNDCQ
ncbi:ABC_transporter substrate-binding protein [Hexamita inflata]|uniref:ABC_transporter substrate-binding protein n=1 Tax=Hexamita inflata TaxID=28002 RepID=A0ABP1GFY3_9EUKA